MVPLMNYKILNMDLLEFGYRYVAKPFFSIVFSFYKLRVYGRERLPHERGFIVAANHSSFLDGPLIAWFLFPRQLHWIIAKWVYAQWYFRPICIVSKCVTVNGSTKLAQTLLEQGEIIGIFPQGGVCCERKIKKGHCGAAVLALKTGAPVVPCYIKTVIDYSKNPNITPKIFTPIKVIFGQPLYFEKCPLEFIPHDTLEITLAQILNAINELGSTE